MRHVVDYRESDAPPPLARRPETTRASVRSSRRDAEDGGVHTQHELLACRERVHHVLRQRPSAQGPARPRVSPVVHRSGTAIHSGRRTCVGRSSRECRGKSFLAAMETFSGARRILRRRWEESRREKEFFGAERRNLGARESSPASRGEISGQRRASRNEKKNCEPMSVMSRPRTKIRGEKVSAAPRKACER